MNKHLREILHARDFAGPNDGRRTALAKISEVMRRTAEARFTLTPDQAREIGHWADAGEGRKVPEAVLSSPGSWDHVILGRHF